MKNDVHLDDVGARHLASLSIAKEVIELATDCHVRLTSCRISYPESVPSTRRLKVEGSILGSYDSRGTPSTGFRAIVIVEFPPEGNEESLGGNDPSRIVLSMFISKGCSFPDTYFVHKGGELVPSSGQSNNLLQIQKGVFANLQSQR